MKMSYNRDKQETYLTPDFFSFLSSYYLFVGLMKVDWGNTGT